MNDPIIEVDDVSEIVSKGETGRVLVVEVAVVAFALVVASALPCPSICRSRLLLLPCKSVKLVVLLVMTDDAAAKFVALGVEDVDFDDAGAIGRRYRRQDEIGTPFCITIDFESLEDQAVTIRERDSMAQSRIALDQVQNYLATKLLGC